MYVYIEILYTYTILSVNCSTTMVETKTKMRGYLKKVGMQKETIPIGCMVYLPKVG